MYRPFDAKQMLPPCFPKLQALDMQYQIFNTPNPQGKDSFYADPFLRLISTETVLSGVPYTNSPAAAPPAL